MNTRLGYGIGGTRPYRNDALVIAVAHQALPFLSPPLLAAQALRVPPLLRRLIIVLIILVPNLEHHRVLADHRTGCAPTRPTHKRRLIVVSPPATMTVLVVVVFPVRAAVAAALEGLKVVVLRVFLVLGEFFGHGEAAVVLGGAPEVGDGGEGDEVEEREPAVEEPPAGAPGFGGVVWVEKIGI